MCFQGDYIRLRANAFCAVFPGSSSLESQRGIQHETKSERDDLPARPSPKVFGAPFYKKARWFSKNSRSKDDLGDFLKVAVKGS
jgi:hypothetical protein